ncbi:MAG: hypothetical protein QW555_00855 [Nitrososphaerota archaeon]
MVVTQLKRDAWGLDIKFDSAIDGKIVFEVPLHLTGFFYPVFDVTPERTGSLGAGLVIRPGLHCTLSTGEGLWFRNRALVEGPAYELYKSLGEGLSISLDGDCMPGAGYGFSAASTLAVAACAVLARRVDPVEAAIQAHNSEVRNRTGLGDVSAIWSGYGLAIRKKAGAPTIGVVESLSIGDNVEIVTSELGRLSTESLLSRYGEKIAEVGREVYREFLKDTSLEAFLTLANRFSREIGLVDERLEALLKPFSRHILGWYVKKRVLVVVTEKSEAPEFAKNIGPKLKVVRLFTPSEEVWKRYLETILATRH